MTTCGLHYFVNGNGILLPSIDKHKIKNVIV